MISTIKTLIISYTVAFASNVFCSFDSELGFSNSKDLLKNILGSSLIPIDSADDGFQYAVDNICIQFTSTSKSNNEDFLRDFAVLYFVYGDLELLEFSSFDYKMPNPEYTSKDFIVYASSLRDEYIESSTACKDKKESCILDELKKAGARVSFCDGEKI